jgi:glutathione S-transferase
MFYLIGTLYPLVTPTYPPSASEYPAARPTPARHEGEGAAGSSGSLASARRLQDLPDGQPFIGGAEPSIADMRLAAPSS